MSKGLQTKTLASLERLLIHGDLRGLDEGQRIEYINQICQLTKINPLLKPFDYISFQGKTVLYANRSATDQLRNIHKISIKITSRERIDGLYVVTAYAITKSGKEDESIGAINIKGLAGVDLANALMKAETKAKRRVTLSITGLGMLDEIEAHEMAEREVKQSAETKVEQVEAKLTTDTDRLPPVTTEAVPDQGYVMKSGRNKGKVLTALSEKALRQWLKFYDDRKATKVEMHTEVDEDAFHVRTQLDGFALEKGEAPSMELKP
jgi:hypothetical protein